MRRPFIWYKNVVRTFVRFVTIHAFDGQTDGRTALRSPIARCVQCSNVKNNNQCNDQRSDTFRKYQNRSPPGLPRTLPRKLNYDAPP